MITELVTDNYDLKQLNIMQKNRIYSVLSLIQMTYFYISKTILYVGKLNTGIQ